MIEATNARSSTLKNAAIKHLRLAAQDVMDAEEMRIRYAGLAHGHGLTYAEIGEALMLPASKAEEMVEAAHVI
ncbi:hypothetical protein [Pseudoclavibacter helvolus]|uniref:hypothetical protein n=1 Tax=Pseudoclavibacter helvolus TaxID=255205 RepID=UPI003C73F657